MFGFDILDAGLVLASLLAFAGGLLSFLSPCVLPVVPPYLAYMGGISMGEMTSPGTARRRVILPALFFVLGLSTIFLLLGFAASAFGRFFLSNLELFNQIAGEQGDIARYGDQERYGGVAKCCVHASQWACVVGLNVADHLNAEAFIYSDVAVGVDTQAAHLTVEPHHRVQCQRCVLEIAKTFVNAAHAASHATGENHASDVIK